MTVEDAQRNVEAFLARQGRRARFLAESTQKHECGWLLYFEEDGEPDEKPFLGGGVWVLAYAVDEVTGDFLPVQPSSIGISDAFEHLRKSRRQSDVPNSPQTTGMQRQPPLRFGPVGEVWPSGKFKVAAELDVEDRWVSELVGLPLMSDFEDGLGPWVGTGGRLSSGAMVELVRYTLACLGPRPFQLRCDFDGDAGRILAEFMEVAKLDDTAVTWRHPSIPVGASFEMSTEQDKPGGGRQP